MMPKAKVESNCRNTGLVRQIVRIHEVAELMATGVMKTLNIMSLMNKIIH